MSGTCRKAAIAKIKIQNKNFTYKIYSVFSPVQELDPREQIEIKKQSNKSQLTFSLTDRWPVEDSVVENAMFSVVTDFI